MLLPNAHAPCSMLHAPCSIKCLFKDIRPALTTSLRLLCTLLWKISRLGKLADRYKCAQPIGEIFLTTTVSLCSGDGQLTTDYGVDYYIKRVIVNSGIRSHTPCFSFRDSVYHLKNVFKLLGKAKYLLLKLPNSIIVSYAFILNDFIHKKMEKYIIRAIINIINNKKRVVQQ